MNNVYKKFKRSFYLILFIVLVSFISFEEIKDGEEKIISKLPDQCANASCALQVTLPNEKFPYIFKVADKLVGNGEVDLSVKNNKITAKALGLGMTCQCNVDFLTTIDGQIASDENINVSIEGTGNPKGILIPGKIGFSGPLKGKVDNDNLIFTGKVNIDGKLAYLAGFKKTEDIVIEIPAKKLINKYKEKR